MKQKLIDHGQQVTLAVMALVILFLGTYRLSDVGQPIMNPDEFGYWANSSFFMGIDWSSAAGMIWYYSYGYSLLLVPVRLLAQLLDWNMRETYQAVVVMQSFMLVGSFLIAVKLCKRYLSDLNWFVRYLSCLAVTVYSSYIVYAHITSAEVLLVFLFWIYLYILMRLTDHSTVMNHICLAFVSFYMYVVHQRCLAILVAAVMIVICMRLQKVNQLVHVLCFFAFIFVMNCVHVVIKGKLQNDLYLANELAGPQQMAGYVLNRTTFILFMAIVFVLLCLWLVESGKWSIAVGAITVVMIVGIIFTVKHFGALENMAGNVDGRLAQNDFAGQLWKIKDIFTLPGFLRLLISFAGKWFYLASATGLIICFGMLSMGKHFIMITIKGVKRLICMWQKRDTVSGCNRTDIWLWGAFLGWLGMFSLGALAMMGIGRVDQLIYARYHEFAAGIVILYGFYSLIKDKKWVLHFGVFLILYLAAGGLCQYLFDELQNSDYIAIHTVMFGGVFRDDEVPTGKVWQVVIRAVLVGIVVCCLLKLFQEKYRKVEIYRMILVLVSAICIYNCIGKTVTKNFVIRRNYIYEENLPLLVMWINSLYQGEKIYYTLSERYYQWGLELQYYLDDKIVTMGSTDYTEDAFYIVPTVQMNQDRFANEFKSVVYNTQFSLIVPKEGNICKRVEEFSKNN